MWLTLTVALVTITATIVSGQSSSPVSSPVSSHNETDRSFSSFSITDVRPSKQVNSSDPSSSTSGPRVKRQQRLPTSENPDNDVSSSSSTTSASTSTDSNPTSPNQSSSRDSDQQQGRQHHEQPSTRSPQQYPAERRANMQPLREDPRLTGPAGRQPESGQYASARDRSAQRSGPEARYAYPTQGYWTTRNPTRRPAPGVGSRGSASASSDSRYPQQSQGRDQPQNPDDRYRDRDSQRLPPQASQNIAVEIELLRFSNERGVLANNRPCDNNGAECSYQISGNLESGDSRNRVRSQQKSEIITTPPKSDAVDILMKTRIVLCGLSAAEPATLRLDVKTSDPSRQRRSRQVRIPTTDQPSDRLTTYNLVDATNDPTMVPYNPDVEDERNRVRQPEAAEDQYSRDRYGDSNDRDSSAPEQGIGMEDRRVPSQTGTTGRGGELVNSFECVINLASAAYQQAQTSQWQTLSCRPAYPNNQMELMFRYNAYSTDAAECDQSRPDLPLIWTPLAASG